MASLKTKDIKGKSEEELLKLLSEKMEALKSFRLGSSGSKTRNNKEGRNNRRDIARILTILNNKQ